MVHARADPEPRVIVFHRVRHREARTVRELRLGYTVVGVHVVCAVEPRRKEVACIHEDCRRAYVTVQTSREVSLELGDGEDESEIEGGEGWRDTVPVRDAMRVQECETLW